PDLHGIITNTRINLAADLYLRDYVGDSGDPTSGIVSQSPDIIVRQAAVAAPQATYGDGSGSEKRRRVVAGGGHWPRQFRLCARQKNCENAAWRRNSTPTRSLVMESKTPQR